MTAAETPDKIATNDHSDSTEPACESNEARAERLLWRIADFGEAVMNDLEDPLDVPDYVLAAVTQAGTALVQLAKLEAQRRPVPAGGRTEVIWDATGDVWVIVGTDRFGADEFECPAGGAVLTAAEIHERRGPVREFVPRPTRPSG